MKIVVQYVNKNWDTLSREELNEGLKNFENSYEELKDWLDRGYVIVQKATDDWFIFHTYRLTLAKE